MIFSYHKPISKEKVGNLARNPGSPEYKKFRADVLERDGHKCQFGGCSETKGLQIHHIKPFAKHKSLATDPMNGITLCEKCHRAIFGKEKLYVGIFIGTVLANASKQKK